MQIVIFRINGLAREAVVDCEKGGYASLHLFLAEFYFVFEARIPVSDSVI